MLRRLPLVVLALLTACSGTAGPTATDPTPITTTPVTIGTTRGPTIGSTIPTGPTGAGDPYFPTLGNTGFDVIAYDISLDISDDLRRFDAATTAITAAASTDLHRFTLDLRGLEIDAIAVGGAPAGFSRIGHDVLVTPRNPIPAGTRFVVVVEYHGTPETVPVPSIGISAGWTVTRDGMYVFAEPDGARTWFPGSDHPIDKAIFRITATVPEGLTAVANGMLTAESTTGGRTTFTWDMPQPMATYLAVLAVGDYRPVDFAPVGYVTRRDWLPSDMDAAPPSFGLIAAMIPVFEEWFGPYPFDSYGHVVVTGFPGAMETQTMSLMGRDALDEDVVAHELTHQWFGNSVTPMSWRDIWLNEGFATFGEFLWLEHAYGPGVMESYARLLHGGLATGAQRPVSDPGELGLFGVDVYHRGGVTLLALRRHVGDDAMQTILTTYHDRFRFGNATTADFVAVAEEVSGRQLGNFFEAWLDDAEPPPFPGA